MILLKNCFLSTTQEIDVIPIHSEVKYALREANLKGGLLTVWIPSEGAGVAVLEPSADTLDGLKKQCQQGTVPVASFTLPFQEGEVVLAPKRQLCIVDFSRTGKRREFVLHVMGESAETSRGTAPRPAQPQRRK